MSQTFHNLGRAFGALGVTTSLLGADLGQLAPRGVWLGQDGHDYCQTSSAPGPNDIQDLHLRLENLPADREIQSLVVRRDGGGEWIVNGKSRSWRGHIIRPPGATMADLYLEPSHREERFRLEGELRFSSGEVARFSVNCGPSDPNLFMPNAQLQATWGGQHGADWTGPGPAVGPDGFEDARLDLAGLSTRLEVAAVTIELPEGPAWEYGLNPKRLRNAELIRQPQDPSRGSLFFSPERDLNGAPLRVRITYKIERTCAITVIAGPTDPVRARPRPPEFRVTQAPLRMEWLGQDRQDPASPADVHVTLEGLSPDREVVAAALTDKVGGCWAFRRDDALAFYPLPGAWDLTLPLIFQRPAKTAPAELFFEPYRDETATPMLLRLLLDDGATVFAEFPGGRCDPWLRGPKPEPTRVEAKPGDDLNALAASGGTVRLGPGTYLLGKPLSLARPVTFTGSRSAILKFTQTPDEPEWSAALLIGASHVTLRGFFIRFTDGFRWSIHGRSGAAILRAFDPPGSHDPKAGLVLENLEIESSAVPLSGDPAKPVEAPYLMRLAGATSGRIVGNRFRGGTVDVEHGPWLIADNEHRGTVPGTVAWDAFGGHWLHDVTLERNRVFADGPSGKIWRFISMNQLGQCVVIRSNDVAGVGMRANDLIPNPNAPEILLTESYRLYFEGRPAAITGGGRVLQLPVVMLGSVRPGSLVSILNGPHAGRYFTIAQPVSTNTFLMADPLPEGEYDISVAHGFAHSLIEGNRIDVRGGNSAVVVLAGNHWDFRVLNNHLMGGGESLRIQSTPTEDPFIWGWSHTPLLDLVCDGNLQEDSSRGTSLDVYSDRYAKSTRGRTYVTGSYRKNIIRWRNLDLPKAQTNTDPIRIGGHSTEESLQMRLAVEGNRFENLTGRAVRVEMNLQGAMVNGEPTLRRKVMIPEQRE